MEAIEGDERLAAVLQHTPGGLGSPRLGFDSRSELDALEAEAARDRLKATQQAVADLTDQVSLQAGSLNQLTALKALSEGDRNRLDRLDETVHRLL